MKKEIGTLIHNKYFPYILILLTTFIQLFILLKYLDYPFTTDDAGYNKMAIQLLNKENFAPYWPPGLPLYIAIFYKVFGVDNSIARAAVFLLYPIFLAYLYLFTKKVSSVKPALLVLIFFIIYPAFRLYSIVPLTEMLASTLLIILLYYLVCYIKVEKFIYLAMVGIFTGLLILTRPSSGLLIIVVFVILYVMKRKLISASLPVLLSVFIILGWIGYCYSMTGKFVPINYANSFNVFLGNNEHAPLYKMWPPVPKEYQKDLGKLNDQIRTQYEIDERDAVYKKVAIDHIKERPDLFLLRTFNRVKVYFSFDTQTAAFFKTKYDMNNINTLMVLGASFVLFMFSLLFFIVALFNYRKVDIDRKFLLLICSIIFAYSLPYFISFSFNRFNVPIFPLITIVSLICFAGIWNQKTKIDFWPLFKLKSKKSMFFVLSVLFTLYIQIEFVFFMYNRF